MKQKMSNRSKHLWIVTFITVLVITAISCSSQINEDPAPRIYIALGDSVSSGFGLHGYDMGTETPFIRERHTTVFFEYIMALNHVDEYKNKAVSGYTTTMLLDLLRNTDEGMLIYFGKAEIITLNIGGNNILSPFLTYLSDMEAVSGADNLRTGAEALSSAWMVIADTVSNSEDTNADEATTEISVGDILSGIRDVVSGIGDLITGGREVASGMPSAISILTGSLSEELDAALEEGVEIFIDEFIQIIEWLENHAPNATIMVNTVYNPIPQEVMGVPIALSNRADELITTMNNVIFSESNVHDFVVVDISPHFDNRLDLMRFNLTTSVDALSFDIIHPNTEGHALIAELQYLYFLRNSDF